MGADDKFALEPLYKSAPPEAGLDSFKAQLLSQLVRINKVAQSEVLAAKSMPSIKQPLVENAAGFSKTQYKVLDHFQFNDSQDESVDFGEILAYVGESFQDDKLCSIDDNGEAGTCLADDSPQVSIDVDEEGCSECSTSSEHTVPEPFKEACSLVILDWDDTLCPSSVLMYQYGLSVLGPKPGDDLANLLDELTIAAKALIEKALDLADRVVIVTNGTHGWVDSCTRVWMPGLADLIEKVEVISARSNWEPVGISCPTKWKEREFIYLLDTFRRQYHGDTWKHFVTVGDAIHEHEALRSVVRETPWCRARRYRSKTVKFVLKPLIVELKEELNALTDSLADVVSFDGDLGLNLSREESRTATPSQVSTPRE